MDIIIASLIFIALITTLGLVFAFYLIVMVRDKNLKDWSNGGRWGDD
jgi:hypothetical protein